MQTHFAFPRNGRSFALMLLAGAAIVGCDSGRLDLCFVDDDDAVQVSPSGRAVAFVDPASYQAILNAPPGARPALECVVDEFTSRFDAEPEVLVFTFDFENRGVTWARLMHDRGFERYPDRAELSDEELLGHAEATGEVLDILVTLPPPPPWSLNATARQLEQGIGISPSRFCSPDCPPLVRACVFLPTR